MKEPEEFELCAQRLRALADRDRLRIVTQLYLGPQNVSDLAAALGDEIVKVSHHLGVLRHAGLVQATKQGRFVIYQLHPEVSISPPAEDGSGPRIEFGCCRVDLTEQSGAAADSPTEIPAAGQPEGPSPKSGD